MGSGSVRAFKLVLAAAVAVLAVTVGFVAVGLLLGVLLVVFAVRALVRAFRPRPVRPAAPPPGPAAAFRRSAPAAGDVIDITATEVPADRLR